MLTSSSRGRGWPSRQRVAKSGFLKVPRPCERAEAATKTSWESREGFSSGGKGLGGPLIYTRASSRGVVQ